MRVKAPAEALPPCQGKRGGVIWTASEIATAMREFRGQQIVGVLDDGATVEVVFSHNAARPNLLSFHENGSVTFGGVEDPDGYVRGIDG
jgi:hypothetical protein